MKKMNLMEDSDELSEKMSNVTIGTENQTCGDCGSPDKFRVLTRLKLNNSIFDA